MKIIELLDKIANGEENDLQTEFEFDGKIWNFYKLNHSEYCLDGWLLNQNITITKHKEVLEEEKKIPEKLPIGLKQTKDGIFNTIVKDDIQYELNEKEEIICKKIHEIIDYLKSKGDE